MKDPYAYEENDTTELEDLEAGMPFTWGKIVKWYKFEEELGITIAKFEDKHEEGAPAYHGWVNGEDTSHSWGTFEKAFVGCLSYKYEGPNGRADAYFFKMIGADPNDQ
jgi:hypothetical protein